MSDIFMAAEPTGAKIGANGQVSARGKETRQRRDALIWDNTLRVKPSEKERCGGATSPSFTTRQGAIIVKFKQRSAASTFFATKSNVIMNRDLHLIALPLFDERQYGRHFRAACIFFQAQP
jgi:hypothetical protein